MMRVKVCREILRWAKERSGINAQNLLRRFPKSERWEKGEAIPTLKQLEGFAKATFTPVGYFFLAEPPVEQIPLPDFRTSWKVHSKKPSPNLLETVYLCQQRQDWYRDFVKTGNEQPRTFVGSARLSDSVEKIAGEMRRALRFDLDGRRDCPTWTEAFRRFIGQADDLGVLVMSSGVVLNNNRRKLDPDEFRGFAIADDLAPLVFVNEADTSAAQIFTLAHELAHLWLGRSALSDADPAELPDHEVEIWCNRVAAEFLVPMDVLRSGLNRDGRIKIDIQRMARRFKVSRLVILRRLYDARAMSRDAFEEAYRAERQRRRGLTKPSGGDFNLTLSTRVSRRFARAIIASTLEGRALHRDAFRLLGISKTETFRELGRELEFLS